MVANILRGGVYQLLTNHAKAPQDRDGTVLVSGKATQAEGQGHKGVN